MLDIQIIRGNPDLIKENCHNRLVDVDVDKILELDKQTRELETSISEMRARRNAISKSKPSDALIVEMRDLGESISKIEDEKTKVDAELRALLLKVPNLTHPEVKVSDDEADNPVLDQYGEIPQFNFEPRDHLELAEKLNLIDFERATKVSGAKFYYLKNDLVFLELALIQYALEVVERHGYQIFSTPDLAKQEILEGLGFNPRGESTQVYNIENTDLSLIGTAEITLGGYHAGEILNESDLPLKYAALSHCFRTEAGSYSKYAKGIFRVHQFTKVEMFSYATPEQSEGIHQELLEIETEVFQGLGIPFRVVDHSTADLGGPSYRTFDLEAWLPGKVNAGGGRGDWAEITSTSNCTDFQARGLNVKYKNDEGDKKFVHTLNGTAISLARAMIAVMENYQTADVEIIIPPILVQYMPNGKDKIKL